MTCAWPELSGYCKYVAPFLIAQLDAVSPALTKLIVIVSPTRTFDPVAGVITGPQAMSGEQACPIAFSIGSSTVATTTRADSKTEELPLADLILHIFLSPSTRLFVCLCRRFSQN